ncbi:TetR/AcrR family transcriptional regulator [Anaeromyxobacter paludicola]|uniref:TetR family transcriptional regulator n=1 Tax=Anaeromyxobacter paludicola TaxID=2918171 RepID=A0ABM7XCL7_9BACT|nr:TetR/AcrR family transcriptional regulator [Anaeromyxobacter paludicola]BDG09572.1 TetR family transcriptional regulator [Anaeromyxobacter paludicola]
MSETMARAALSQAKQQQILAGARAVFLEVGFERASVDVMAARAGVSKATVYSHFQDKKALFVACSIEQSAGMRQGVLQLLEASSGDLENDLLRLGETVMRYVLSRDAIALRRVVVAEASRFPELGRALWEDGACCMRTRFSEFLQKWVDAGVLRIADLSAASGQFLALCRGELYLLTELGVVDVPADEQIRETVRGAVQVFLRAYRA